MEARSACQIKFILAVVAEASKDLQLEVELEEVEASNVQMQSVSDKNGQNTDICLATFNPQPK